MITLKGQPLSTNNLYKTTCMGKYARVYMTDTGKELKADYVRQVKRQWKQDIIKGEVSLSCVVYHKDKRNRDIDNTNKLIFDSLSGIVFDDDKQIKELYLRKEIDKENPRVDIEIMEL